MHGSVPGHFRWGTETGQYRAGDVGQPEFVVRR